MRTRKEPYGLLATAVGLLTGVALVVLAVQVCLPKVRDNARLRRQLLDVQGQIHAEQQRLSEVKREVASLEHDPKAVERAARLKLHYARPNETVVVFEPARPTTPPAGTGRR